MDFANMTTSDIEQRMLENAMAEQGRMSKADDRGKWLALAQAMGSPTSTGTFGEGLGNVAGALGKHNAGEQERLSKANDIMQNVLGTVYKQKMDLEEKKQKLKDSMKRKFFQTAEGTFGFADEDNQTVDVRAVGPSQMKIVEKLQNRYTDILSKQGGYTDANELRQAAYQLAMRDYTRMINDTSFVPAKAGVNRNPGGISSNEPIPGTDDPLAPVAGINMAKFKNVGKALEQPVGGIMTPDSDNVFGEPVGKDPLGDPRYLGKIPGVNDKPIVNVTGGFPIKTPQQIEIENAETKSAYDSGLKQHDEAQASLGTYLPLKNTVADMEARTLGGMSSGIFAEPLQKAGNLISYFDPKNELARYASNSEEYELHLMDLVRTKIQALGAGTAISNLDLLVTKMAAGDKSLTTQGRMMLLGALKGAAENSRIENERKIAHFAKNKSMVGYKPLTDSQAVMMPVMSKGPDGPVMRYDVLTYDNFKNKMAAAHPNEVNAPDFDKIVRRSFDKQAKMYREWISTGVDPRTKKAK